MKKAQKLFISLYLPFLSSFLLNFLVFISVVKRSAAVTYKEKTAPRQEVIMNTAS